MSDDIKSGDVCEVIGCCCLTAKENYAGMECCAVKVGKTFLPFKCQWCGWMTRAFWVVAPNIVTGTVWVPAEFLRKKPPKADDANWIRQETVPLERFNRWREHLRRVNKVRETEPA